MSSLHINVIDEECEEALMAIRISIKKQNLKSGETITITSRSEPFWLQLKQWAAYSKHELSRSTEAEAATHAWSAVITLH